MFEIIKDIFVGSEDDYYNYVKFDQNFNVVHAKSEPYYIQGLVSLQGRENTPLKGYKYCFYQGSLCLDFSLYNYLDDKYDEMFNRAYEYIKMTLENKMKVFVHCSQGVTRSPTVVFYYLMRIKYLNGDFNTCMKQFFKLYPSYSPNENIVNFLKRMHTKYQNK